MPAGEKYDLDRVKAAASGQWASVIQRITGIDSLHLTGKHCPCPKCGGKDRFKIMKDFDQTGGVICNQCGKFSDGLATIEWFHGIPFIQTLEKVAQCVGVEPQKATQQTERTDPTKNLSFQDAFPILIAKIWAKSKPPVAAESLQLVGTRYGMYRKQNPVFALPAIGHDGVPCGWFITHATAKKLPIFEKGNKEPVEWRSTKCTAGSQAGWLGPIQSDQHEIIWKVEGPSDMLALLTLGLPANHTVCTNLFGAGEDPASNPWMLERFRGKTVYVLHDCDKPGQSGALEVSSGPKSKRPGWAPAIANVANECRNVVLPYPIQDVQGKDLRDWIGEQLSEGLSLSEVYQRFLDLAQRSPTIEGQSIATKKPKHDIRLTEAEYIDDPWRLARINLARYLDEQKRTIRYWKETFYSWQDGRYEEMTTDHLSTRLWGAIKDEFDRAYKEEMEAYVAWCESPDYSKELDRGAPKTRKLTNQLVQNTIGATKSLTILRNSQQLHAWTDGVDRGHCVSVQNGILNITKAIAEPSPPAQDILLPHTPDWFSTTKLNFQFDPYAQCPSWIRFLIDVFNGDKESIDLLQKWFGYLLTPDNSLQKILFVIGEPRSGKGTILHTIKSLFGEDNVATPTLNSLSKEFSLQPLIGKTIAVIPDARLSDRADETTITERLLSISGGDPQDINRKYKDTLTNHGLKIRFTLFSNMLPRIKDPSAAFISRCVFLRMPNTYLGREDIGLRARLDAELPGILNWAIIGRHKLNSTHKLPQPLMAQSLVSEMRAIVSPMIEFISEACEIRKEAECDTKEMFTKWEQWCAENDVAHPGNIQSFSRKLRAIKPQVDTIRRCIGSNSVRFFVGIGYRDSQKY
jgi:P4 family phage/plasmid primase-like protien